MASLSGQAVSTAAAYAQVKPSRPAISLCEIINRPVSEWKDLMINDFEGSVFPAFPAIQSVKEKLYAAGAVYASMSGSGSSVFGLFQSETHLKSLFPDCFVWEGLME